MPYCPACGSEVRAGDDFCTDCGNALASGHGGQETADAGASTDAPTAASAGGQPAAGDEAAAARTATERGSGFTPGQKLLFAGAGLAVVGALLPWLTADVVGTSVSKNGIEGDGVITLVLGVIAGGVGFARWGRVARASIVVAGVLVALFGLVYISDPLFGVDVPATADGQLVRQAIRPGIGLYLTALGGLAILGGPLVDYAR